MPKISINRRKLVLGLFALGAIAAGTVEARTSSESASEITHPSDFGIGSQTDAPAAPVSAR